MEPVAIIIGSIFALAVLVNPFIGLCAIIALIPQALMPSIGNLLGPFTGATPIKLVGALTFLAAAVNCMVAKKRLTFLGEPIFAFYLCFLVYVFINGFAMPSSFTREFFTFYTSIAAIGFIIVSQVDSQKRLRVVLWIFFISLFIVGLSSILNYAQYTNTAARMRGAAYGPNYFAISLLPFIAISFYTGMAEKKGLLKIAAIGISIVLLGALALTQSRGGFIGLAVMLLISIFFAKRKGGAIALICICCVAVLFFMPETFWERFFNTRLSGNDNEATGSAIRRWYLAKAAWILFLKSPIFGIGLGNYFWKSGNYFGLIPGRTHNMYLEILSEMGIIGTFLFSGVMISFLKSLKRMAKACHPYHILAKGIFIGMVGFYTAALFLHAQNEKTLWVIIFLTLAMERIWRSEQPKKNGPGKKLKPKGVGYGTRPY